MINKIQIKNFKSVVDLTLDVGSFNVLIGENGCGKSNILEAIAFGAAASADKLDFEFLGSRGLRVSNPEFMFSAFSSEEQSREIGIDFKTDNSTFQNIDFLLSIDSENSKNWINKSKEFIQKNLGDRLATILFEKNNKEKELGLKDLFSSEDNISVIQQLAQNIQKISKSQGKEEDAKDFFKFIFNTRFLKDRFYNEELSRYIIYSLEESRLRKFEDTNQIYPLGIKGEGLFQYLKELAFDKKSAKTVKEIKETLALLDWYDGFDLPDNLMSNEYALKIKDKYLHENLQFFDQRSTNEGFLYLLFYAALFISKATPTFFAIDNIDASFNPKLCVQLIKTLAALAKKYKKQVIVTTHNPAVLDGLNLKDDNQRLFVVSRNSEGHTRAKRIEHNDKRTTPLSQIWTNGLIGGLPDNF